MSGGIGQNYCICGDSQIFYQPPQFDFGISCEQEM